jgi:hypothetical protein
MLQLGEPRIIERDPYQIVGVYCTYEGETPEDEGPGWAGADKGFFARKGEITNRTDSNVLGFLYRPHKDHPEIPESVRACFIGVEVSDLDHVPAGMSTTRFSGGQYIVVACRGDTEAEAAGGVGEAIGFLMRWIPEHGYAEGDACFACGDEQAVRPPFVEVVYIKIDK